MRHVRRLIGFTAGYFWPCVASGTVLFCVLPLALGLATRAFFDAFANDAAGGIGAWTAVAVIAGLQLSEVMTGMVLVHAWSGFSQKTHVLLRRNLFAGVLRGFGRYGLVVPPGDALSRFQADPPVVTLGSMDGICDLIGRGVFAVMAAVVMWRTDPVLTIAAFTPVVVAALVSDALGSRAARYGAAALDATTGLSRFLGEIVAAQLAVRVAGAQGRVVDRLAGLGETRRRLSLRDRVFAEAVNAMNYHLVHVSTGAVLLLGAARIRSGTFSVGDIALFIVFLDQLTYLPAEIGRVVTELKRTGVSIERMHALLPGDPTSAVVAPAPVYLGREAPAAVAPPIRERLDRLEVSGLTYRHPSSGRGIDEVSFTLERGSLTVVTGRVGAGKSTLLHAVLGLLPATGEVRWNSRVLDEPGSFLVPPQCAFTPQVPRLFSESLGDNLLLGRSADPAAIRAALRAAVLEGDMDVLDHGLGTLVGPRGVKLSGGQVQRAAAARMFLPQAEIVVFDDLSSALDAATEAELWARLFAERDDLTCLAVSHSSTALARADQVLTLVDGRQAGGGRGGGC